MSKETHRAVETLLKKSRRVAVLTQPARVEKQETHCPTRATTRGVGKRKKIGQHRETRIWLVSCAKNWYLGRNSYNKLRSFMIAAVDVKSHRTANGGHVFITACQAETF